MIHLLKKIDTLSDRVVCPVLSLKTYCTLKGRPKNCAIRIGSDGLYFILPNDPSGFDIISHQEN